MLRFTLVPFTSRSKVCINAWSKPICRASPGMFSLFVTQIYSARSHAGSLRSELAPYQCWTGIGFFTYPSATGIWFLKKNCIPWQYGYWGKNMKTHTRWYQYVQSLQFSHHGMSIMVLRCVILEGYIVSIWICWFNVWCHKLKRKKSLMNLFKKTNKTLVTTKLICRCFKIITNASLIKG